jgi:hypothetical protein
MLKNDKSFEHFYVFFFLKIIDFTKKKISKEFIFIQKSNKNAKAKIFFF